MQAEKWGQAKVPGILMLRLGPTVGMGNRLQASKNQFLTPLGRRWLLDCLSLSNLRRLGET